MDSGLCTQARIGQRALFLTTAAVPLTGWTVHAIALHRRLAAAKKDPLTGLLRRDAYTAQARQVLARHGDNVAVVLVDADHFKDINDMLGHPTGDVVLAAFGARLTAWADRSASVGRLGGDESAVVLPMSPGRHEVRLATLVSLLRTPVILDDSRTVDVAASVGAATPDVIGTSDLSLLQRAADAALHNGKHSGRAHLATKEHATVASINGRSCMSRHQTRRPRVLHLRSQPRAAAPDPGDFGGATDHRTTAGRHAGATIRSQVPLPWPPSEQTALCGVSSVPDARQRLAHPQCPEHGHD